MPVGAQIANVLVSGLQQHPHKRVPCDGSQGAEHKLAAFCCYHNLLDTATTSTSDARGAYQSSCTCGGFIDAY